VRPHHAKPRPGIRLLAKQTNVLEAANSLQISPGEKVISLRRIRLANSSPMTIEWSRIPHRLCPDLLDVFEPSGSLYETLAQHYGIRMAIADEIAEAGLASAREARLLGVAKGSPVFLFTRISYVQSGDPAEFVKSICRADRYKIVSRLTRRNR
jgi:GntR family transcriptional regulator